MTNLFFDDFVKSQGFQSTEDYIMFCLEERLCPRFDKVDYYKDLFSKGLIVENFSIRTSDAGRIDKHYWVASNGDLIGADEGPYPGEKGTFKPEKILVGERISSGWTIESLTGISVLFRDYLKNQ